MLMRTKLVFGLGLRSELKFGVKLGLGLGVRGHMSGG